MTQKLDNLIVVLDLGSAWTRVLAADLNEGALRYRGHAWWSQPACAKGLIAELAPAAKVVKAANERAERAARINIEELRGRRRRAAYSRAPTPATELIWAIACAKLPAKTCATRWSGRGPSSVLRTAKFCTWLPRQFILD